MSNLNINYQLRVLPSHCVLVTRNLSPQSKIVVMKNQPVTPTDILGINYQTAGFSSINLGKRFGIDPRNGYKYLKQSIGSNVERGELLALKTGVFGQKTVHSPVNGRLESYDEKSGRLLIRFSAKEITVLSGVYGIVEEINKANGEVVIKTMATEILGPFGIGGRCSGALKIFNNFQSQVQSRQVTSDMRNHIVISDGTISGVILKKMLAYGVSGVVCGGLNYNDFKRLGGDLSNKSANPDTGLSIIATEGFGQVLIGDDLKRLLKKHEGQFSFIDGEGQRLVLPEMGEDVILTVSKIQLPKGGNSRIFDGQEIYPLQKGDQVRLIVPPLMGRQGIVYSIDKTPTLLESGLKIYCVIVNLGSQKIKVPYTNIERV